MSTWWEAPIPRDLIPVINEALGDRFTIEREIARGGAGRVFLASDAQDRKIALKILHPELAVSVQADRFLREIELLARLEHPLIAKLLDYGERDWARSREHTLSSLPGHSPVKLTSGKNTIPRSPIQSVQYSLFSNP